LIKGERKKDELKNKNKTYYKYVIAKKDLDKFKPKDLLKDETSEFNVAVVMHSDPIAT